MTFGFITLHPQLHGAFQRLQHVCHGSRIKVADAAPQGVHPVHHAVAVAVPKQLIERITGILAQFVMGLLAGFIVIQDLIHTRCGNSLRPPAIHPGVN